MLTKKHHFLLLFGIIFFCGGEILVLNVDFWVKTEVFGGAIGDRDTPISYSRLKISYPLSIQRKDFKTKTTFQQLLKSPIHPLNLLNFLVASVFALPFF